jgi:hypothetical protein
MLIPLLSPLAPDPPSKLNVLGHDGDALGMDGTEVSVFEQTDQVRLRCFLQRQHRMALEPQVSLKILSNLTDQPLEWQLPYQKLRTLLVLANFSISSSYIYI